MLLLLNVQHRTANPIVTPRNSKLHVIAVHSVPDPHLYPDGFGPPVSASGSVSDKYKSGSGTFPFLIKKFSFSHQKCFYTFEAFKFHS
jgi:hypothetical protein